MNNEQTKIFAGVLVAGIVASLSGFVASKLSHPHKLEQNAFKIEGVAEAGGAPAAEAKPEPILELIATGDTAKGQQVAKICASCHNFEKGGPNGLGPNLYGIVGRAKGSHKGFDYSAGMKAKGGNWTYEDLNHFLWKPKSFVDGTKMTFIGLKKPEDRVAVIAWLRTLSDSPAAPPTEADIAAEKAELAPPATETPPATGNAAETGAAAEGAVKPDAAKDATAAVPEGNAGTGKPESNPDVPEGKAPEAESGSKKPKQKH